MLKFKLNEHYYGYHYVWCSPVFEAEALAMGALGRDQAASSDPATLYRRLARDIETKDRHSGEIKRQKDGIKATALLLRSQGKIDAPTAARIAETVDRAAETDFRPILYVIPYEKVVGRLELVPVKDAAGLEPEYIVPDLKSHEFQMVMP